MDFKSIYSDLTSGNKGDKYFYTEPEIQDQERIVEGLKQSGVDAAVITAQEAQLNKMKSRRQEPRNEADYPSSLDFLKAEEPAFAAGIDTPQSPPPTPLRPDMSQFTSGMKEYNALSAPKAPAPTTMADKPTMDMPIPGMDEDQMRRDALDKEQKKSKLSELFPQALAGFGDVVTAAGVPYGTAQTHGLKDIQSKQAEGKKTAKEDMEKKFLTDPKSSASKVAQSAAARLLGKTPADLSNMSVSQIDKAFPIWKEALNNEEARELKKLQLEMMKQQSVEKKEMIEEGRNQRADDRQKDDFYKVGKDLVNDNRYKEMGKQQMGLTSVRNLIEEVRSGNTVASAAIGAKLARAMGEVGVLTEEDVKRYQRSGWLPQRAADKVSQMIQGRPTDWTLQEIEDIASGIEKAFDANKKPIQEDYVKRMARSYNIPEERAAYLLNVPEIAPAAKGIKQPKASPKTSNTMIMKHPKTGKRYEVDKTTKQVIKEVL